MADRISYAAACNEAAFALDDRANEAMNNAWVDHRRTATVLRALAALVEACEKAMTMTDFPDRDINLALVESLAAGYEEAPANG